MKIHKIINQMASENTYILEEEQSLIVIDPGSEQMAILKQLRELNKMVVAILLTHAHFDHIMSVDTIKKLYPEAIVYIGSEEEEWLKNPTHNLSQGMLAQEIIIDSEVEIYEIGKNYQLDDFEFTVKSTPGHSVAGVSLVFDIERVVFTGDALFKNTIGRTDFYTGDYQTLIDSVKRELFSLPSDYKVYPGHFDSTSISDEMENNPYFKA